MKTMIIGLGPEYNYPGSVEEWIKNDTNYASNHGASLISRSLSKEFRGEYVDDFSNIYELNREYDRCILAFATHITSVRDVSFYADVIEKLDMPVYAFSLGIQDYASDTRNVHVLHPSMRRLLDAVLLRSNYIGVRGPYTAAILHGAGYRNVLPIGCPTLFWNQSSILKIKKSDSFGNPAIPYHRTMAKYFSAFLSEAVIIGQDFLDEVVFLKKELLDPKLARMELKAYFEYGNFDEIRGLIDKNGIFPSHFDEWFNLIGSKDFVVGARLHGCIAGLIQGIPAVMLARDLRVKEIAEFFKIPYYMYEDAKGLSMEDIYREADFSEFESTYRIRYRNYLSFLSMNEIENDFPSSDLGEIDYLYTLEDKLTMQTIQFKTLQSMHDWQSNNAPIINRNTQAISKMRKIIDKVPFMGRIRSKLK